VLTHNNIDYRYVGDILIICNKILTDINHTLQEFNNIQPNQNFTIEKGKKKQNKILRHKDTKNIKLRNL
jgi:hypothetical protein